MAELSFSIKTKGEISDNKSDSKFTDVSVNLSLLIIKSMNLSYQLLMFDECRTKLSFLVFIWVFGSLHLGW